LSNLVDEQHPTPPITYYALDLEKLELERTISELAASDVGLQLQGKVATKGMWGTYDGGLKFIQEGGLHGRNATSQILAEAPTFEGLRDMSPVFHRDSGSESSRSSENDQDSDVITAPSTPGTPQRPLHILFLGSSLGNFVRGDDANFLRGLPLRPGSGDTLLLGLDHDNDPAVIELAYNDPSGITRKFLLQGKSPPNLHHRVTTVLNFRQG
jgi:L-histidine Nalpha-methyltransferase / hercynylcysteine S-oxide synthase